MNTPSHIIINLAMLGAVKRPYTITLISLGAMLPDVPIFLFYGWAKLVLQQPEPQIWRETYFQPFWQTLIHGFHSIPMAIAGLLIGHYAKILPLKILSLSALLHSCLDFPVHNDDAHRHFLPLSNYRFISPLSYWDPNHYGVIVAFVERALVLGASCYIFPVVNGWLGQGVLVSVNLLYWAKPMALLYRAWIK